MPLLPSPNLECSLALAHQLKNENITQELLDGARQKNMRWGLTGVVAVLLMGLTGMAMPWLGLWEASAMNSPAWNMAVFGLLVPGLITTGFSLHNTLKASQTIAALQPLSPETSNALLEAVRESDAAKRCIREALHTGRTLRVVDADCAYEQMRKASSELAADRMTCLIREEAYKP